jgi:tetratricopeptide (TPR) repeat protein
MFLTHLDEDGNDSPAILIENSTAANRAVNIPEFVNIPPGGLMNIDAQVTDYYRVIDTAKDLTKEHKYNEAAAAWRNAVEINPKDAENRFNLGAMLLATGKLDDAIAEFGQALALNPDYVEAHNNLGLALARKGRLDDAVVHLSKALQLDPAQPVARRNLGMVLAQAGKIEEAIPYLRSAVEEKPEDAEAQANLGLALALTRRFDEAIAHLRIAVAASPGSFEYQFNLARALASAGRSAEAIPQFELAVRLSGGREPSVLDMLGRAYADAGRFQDAARVARQALEIASRQNNAQLADGLKSRIAYYESRIPQPK